MSVPNVRPMFECTKDFLGFELGFRKEVIMKIGEMIKEIPKQIKYVRDGKKIESLNKNIEFMTFDEIIMEIDTKIRKINKLNEFDERTEELIGFLLNKSVGERDRIFELVLAGLKTQELRLKFLDKFGNCLSDEVINNIVGNIQTISGAFTPELNNKVRREMQINNLKIKVNDLIFLVTRRGVSSKNQIPGLIDDSKNPLQFKIKYVEYEKAKEEEKKVQDKVLSILFFNNFDRLDIYDFLKSSNYSLISRICDNLPQEVKGPFMLEYLETNGDYFFNSNEEEKIYKIILDSIPIQELKEKIIQDRWKFNNVYSKFNDKIDITFSDIQDYYRKTGHYVMFDKVEVDIDTADEIIGELKYFKDKSERTHFLNSVIYKLPEGEIDKLLESQKVEDDLKSSIYKTMVFYKNDEEKLKIYEKLISLSEDEKTKNDYKISMARILENYDEIFEIIKSGEYHYEYLISRDVLLNFSDEKIKEIYDMTDDYALRAYLLQLTRKNINPFFDIENDNISRDIELSSDADISTEVVINSDMNISNDVDTNAERSGKSKDNIEIKAFTWEDKVESNQKSGENAQIEDDDWDDKKSKTFYDRNKKEYILVNEENYIDFIRNAKSYIELTELLSFQFEDYKSKVPFEEILDLYKEFSKKDLEIYLKNVDDPKIYYRYKDICVKSFRMWLYHSNLSIDNYFKLIDMDFSKDDLEMASNSLMISSEQVNIDDMKKYIKNISKIQDIDLKERVLKKFEDAYLSRPIYSREDTEEYKEFKDRVFKLENLFDEFLEGEDIDITDKYVLLSHYMEMVYINNRTAMDENQEKQMAEKFKIKFKKLNELSGKNEYTEIFDFSPVYEEDEFYGRRNKTNYRNIIDCIKYLNSDIIYDKLVSLYNQNHSIKQYISPFMLNDEVIQILDDDIIEFISRYSVDASSFGDIFENQEKTNIFLKAYDRLKSVKAYSEEDALKIAKFINTIDLENLKSFTKAVDVEFNEDKIKSKYSNKREEDIKLGEFSEKALENGISDELEVEKLDLIISVSLSENLRRDFSKLKIGEDKNIFDKYVRTIKEKTRRKIHSPILTKVQALDAIGTRFFGLSYSQMRDFVHKYGVDLDVMINKYKKKDGSLTLEEQNEVKALNVLRNIREILSIEDKKALIETFDELDKLQEFENLDFSLSYALDENLRRVYAKDYKENMYSLKEEDKSKEKVDGIDVYYPKEFNMLVHVVAAYGDFKLIDEEHPEKSAREFWRNIDDKQNHILCTSYIGNSNLCFKRIMENEKESKDEQKNGKNVIFGFSKFSKNSILMAAPFDLGSDTKTIESNRSFKLSSFRSAINMIRNTRGNHNEVSVERRLENQKNINIEPDYIVCIDEIDGESKKVAKDFGIPIVVIDTKEIAKNESQKIDELFKSFYETKDTSKISEIVSLYSTNLNSFSNFRTELKEKYFNPLKMNENIRKLIQWIDREYRLGNTENAKKCYLSLHKAFQHEIDLNMQNGLDPEENTAGKLEIREFNYELKQKCKSFGYTLDSSEKILENSDSKQIENQTGNEEKIYQVVSKIKEGNQNYDR